MKKIILLTFLFIFSFCLSFVLCKNKTVEQEINNNENQYVIYTDELANPYEVVRTTELMKEAMDYLDALYQEWFSRTSDRDILISLHSFYTTETKKNS